MKKETYRAIRNERLVDLAMKQAGATKEDEFKPIQNRAYRRQMGRTASAGRGKRFRDGRRRYLPKRLPWTKTPVPELLEDEAARV